MLGTARVAHCTVCADIELRRLCTSGLSLSLQRFSLSLIVHFIYGVTKGVDAPVTPHKSLNVYILGTVTLNLVYTWNYLGSVNKSPCHGPARPNAAESQEWDQASLFFTSRQAHSAGPCKWRTTDLGPHSGLGAL